MNVKGFFVDTLSSALELGIATPEDVTRHVTPDILAVHLPRPLWARLLTAALGAPKVDAQLVIETIGVPNLCEHVPSTIIWACVAEIGQRALSGVPAQPSSRVAAVTPPAMKAQPQPQAQPQPAPLTSPPPLASTQPQVQPLGMASPPPPEVKREPTPRDTPSRGVPLPAVSAAIPKPSNDGLADVVAALESDERQTSPAGRARSATGPRFRQSNTGVGRLGAMSTRRPQAPVPAEEAPRPGAASATAAAAAAASAPAARPANRGQTEADEFVVETEPKDDWKSSLAVEDEQLVDWQASEETVTGGEEYRKR